jgi:hypothetical protein
MNSTGSHSLSQQAHSTTPAFYPADYSAPGARGEAVFCEACSMSAEFATRFSLAVVSDLTSGFQLPHDSESNPPGTIRCSDLCSDDWSHPPALMSSNDGLARWRIIASAHHKLKSPRDVFSIKQSINRAVTMPIGKVGQAKASKCCTSSSAAR